MDPAAVELREIAQDGGRKDAYTNPTISPATNVLTQSAFPPQDTNLPSGHPDIQIEPQKTTSDNGLEPVDEPNVPPEETREKRGLAFWCIIFVLCVTSILSALEGTIISTALPSIVSELGGEELYVWAVNGFFLTR